MSSDAKSKTSVENKPHVKRTPDARRTSSASEDEDSEDEDSDLVDGKSSWPSPDIPHVFQKPAYSSRTLDQFYYPALDDTSARDKDQTISKWSGTPLDKNGRDEAADDSLVIMVDQFWCWIIDESVLSVFPAMFFDH